jgi:acetyl esterase
MTVTLNEHARKIMSRVWPKYTAAVPRAGEPADVYRAERDAYVREINTSDAVVRTVDLISIEGPAGTIPVRIYRPDVDVPGPLPVVLYLHGGGWTVGGGDALDATYRAFCAGTGCLVVVPDYRLAPEHKFPAAVDDCWAAARWLAGNTSAIGGDPDRMAIAGESSGGNLAAVVSSLARNDPGVRFRLQCLVYPALDLGADTPSYRDTQDVFTRDKMIWYINCYIREPQDADNPLASPVRAQDFFGLPPTVLVTGGADPLLDEAEDYAAKLRQAGVRVDYLRLDGWPHGFAFWSETEAYRQMMTFTTCALRGALATP